MVEEGGGGGATAIGEVGHVPETCPTRGKSRPWGR